MAIVVIHFPIRQPKITNPREKVQTLISIKNLYGYDLCFTFPGKLRRSRTLRGSWNVSAANCRSGFKVSAVTVGLHGVVTPPGSRVSGAGGRVDYSNLNVTGSRSVNDLWIIIDG